MEGCLSINSDVCWIQGLVSDTLESWIFAGLPDLVAAGFEWTLECIGCFFM